MGTVCPENECILLLQGQVHIINLPLVNGIWSSYEAIPVAHKARGGLRRIDFGINDTIGWTSINSSCTSSSSTDLPFVGNESRMDLVDLVILEHRSVLIEYAWLRKVRSRVIRCRYTIRRCIYTLEAITSD
jgi:hypothetical protein